MKSNESIIKAFSMQTGKLLCSVCSVDEPVQPMMTVGGTQDWLMCPHCNLVIDRSFSEAYFGSAIGDNLWEESQIAKFLQNGPWVDHYRKRSLLSRVWSYFRWKLFFSRQLRNVIKKTLEELPQGEFKNIFDASHYDFSRIYKENKDE